MMQAEDIWWPAICIVKYLIFLGQPCLCCPRDSGRSCAKYPANGGIRMTVCLSLEDSVAVPFVKHQNSSTTATAYEIYRRRK